MSIVCIGDSLTFGYGVKESDNWVNILSLKTKKKFINKGIPGNTTFEMKDRFIQDVINENPSKVLIMGGKNDIFLKKDINTILKNIESMIKLCNINNIEPLLLTPLIVNENISVKQWFKDRDYKEVNVSLTKFRKLLVEFANIRNINCIDLSHLLLKKKNVERYFLDDGIHISRDIHKEMAEFIFSSKPNLLC
ncbi:lysophospholipase L1-like esterase [Clostridium tetanomorphum]|uniref:Acyl-CoA thioesterase n=1 Tax=Clostridium tetanomorphum TaxID=1553 RepID=A0A923ECJ6_CLOTT|nr:GDSL-type esterase/lipase family protein [Clostridium tetanomorphum]KAJ52404.1 esterase [Clostridium tetanomorphum DSM 665]MBC2397923.1 acyl-CoA thioesterase [Clostridium tetanomorphum]MBP1864760.1 lysophospholipase L1-like esterase [Clostridium tetanomorphum]NRS83936.1 lysophospholipase L1-like esterase [Clostridium tetanomorphum]NRZ97155.1 lysophospholipase L1-like esterase [Clostridium tetanomorphum]